MLLPPLPVDNAAGTQASAPPAAPAANDDPATARAPAQAGSGDWGTYRVRRGDTLMKIAFETYGDLYRWKDLFEANRDVISNPNSLPPGKTIKFEKPSTPVEIQRNGEKYLIKLGDTLGTISNDVYGTQKKWRRIYKNNRAMIKDPNKIFAGFTLYYPFTDQDKADFEKYRGGSPEAAPALSQNTPSDAPPPPVPQQQMDAPPTPTVVAQAPSDASRAPAQAGALQDMAQKLQGGGAAPPPPPTVQ